MLATHVLEKNHRNLRRLFAESRRATDRPRRARLFDEIKRSIRAQLAVEEEMLYPTLSGRPSPERGARFDALLSRHFEIEELVTELTARGPQDASFDHRMRILEGKMAVYFLEVRRGPYREARRRLSRRRLEELGGVIRARLDLVIRPALGE